MKCLSKYLPVLLLAAACCHGSKPSQAALNHYEDSVYCFNGRSIVQAGGLYGMTDSIGTLILPLEYQSLEFLSDEVALGEREGHWYLLTREGEVARQGNAPHVAEGWETAYEGWLQRRDNFWDVALDRYEALCNTCIALRLSERPEARELSEAVSQLEWLRNYLSGADCRMPASRARRFQALTSRYQQYAQ